MNPYADLARQRKATDIALSLSKPLSGLSAIQRQDGLYALATSIEALLGATRDGVSDSEAHRFFREAELNAGVNESSPETWDSVVTMLRALASAAVDDPFANFG